MLAFFFYLQFHIHTDPVYFERDQSDSYIKMQVIKDGNSNFNNKIFKINKIKMKANFQSIRCGEINSQIGSYDSWLNNGAITESLINCQNGIVKISGMGIYKAKCTVLNLLPNGLINIVNSNFLCSVSKIYASGATSKKVQLINFQGKGTHSIMGTEFEFCGFSPKSNLPNDWDPSLICISGNSTNSFSDLFFTHPDTNNPSPDEICQTRSIKIEGSCSLELFQCNLYKSSCYTKGGAISIQTIFTVEITNCNFKENKAPSGGAISIEKQIKHASILNCSFIGNSGLNSNSKGGAVYIEGGNCFFSKCKFYNNSCEEKGHALCITGKTTNVIHFENCEFSDNSKSNKGSQIFIDGKSSLEISYSSFKTSSIEYISRAIELSNGNLNVHHTKFTNLEAPSSNSVVEGNAILVNRGENEAIIEDNQFVDCYITDQLSYIITFNGSSLNFNRNEFNFSPKKGCGCLRVYTTGNIIIIDNLFSSVNLALEDFYGAFIYEETERLSYDYHTIIRNNLFNKCSSSKQIACFFFKWKSQDYEFTNNTFQYNSFYHGLGKFDFMGYLNNGTFHFAGNNFINNTGRSVWGGGSGLLFQNKGGDEFVYENHFLLIIDETYFYGNVALDSQTDRKNHYRNGNGGALQIGWIESYSNIDLEIVNCLFLNNFSDRQGGALTIHVIGYTIINNCTFEGNIAGQRSKDPQRVLGGAIYMVPDFFGEANHYPNGGIPRYSDKVVISKCMINKNIAQNGFSIFIESAKETNIYIIDCQIIDCCIPACTNYSIICFAKELIFENSNIVFSSSNGTSSGILVSQPTRIINSKFIKNSMHDVKRAEVLLIENDAKEVEITETLFEDCGYGGNDYAAIKIYSPNVNIHNAVINYTSNQIDKSCLPVLINDYCDLIFYDVNISNSHCNGAFQYNPKENKNAKHEKILIEKCTFENCQGQNARAISIKLSSKNLTFTNNTIQNCSATGLTTAGGYLFDFDFTLVTITEFVFNKIVFRNLKTDSDFGGGIGLSIQQNIRFKLIFTNCIFDDNYALYNKQTNGCNNGKGGAIQFGWLPLLSNASLSFENCIFSRNKADEEGGALCLMIQGNIEISNCQFINNICGLKSTGKYFGGAISITPNYGYQQNEIADSISIEQCSFIGNAGHEANSIYIKNGQKTDVSITNNCYFEENSTETSLHSSIMTDSRNFKVNDCSFEFSSISLLSGETESNQIFSIVHCQFRKSNSGGAIQLFQTKGTIDSFLLTNCDFEVCNGSNSSCLSLMFQSDPSFVFKDSIFRYTKETSLNKYLYSFSFTNKDIIIIENVSFIDVKSGCLYGGGTGIWITGVNKIIFEKCMFINNTATQTKNSEIRPNLANKKIPYYNGDGGGFQYGYSESLYNTEIEIIKCSFRNNKATRHGGGIAIQTTKKITITDCIFENNDANHISSELNANLLFDNYFDLKTEGRGGAIYFNPAFSHPKKPDNSFLPKIEIITSTFKSNTAFDGCAIYIEGDDAGTEFIITQNIFIDNYNNDENPKLIRKGIITSEIYNLFDGKIITSNEFTNTNELIEKVLYVDHYGNIPTDEFTASFIFTPEFSQSYCFSQSNKFTQSVYFSKSNCFSKSNAFSHSYHFSQSNDFTQSVCFSKSNFFIQSNTFSHSYQFSQSNDFTRSVYFSKSNSFTESNDFTQSTIFSKSFSFTQSNYFINCDQRNCTLTKSFILTYTRMRSVSFSISYFESNTFLMSFNSFNSTYYYMLKMSNYYDYFPYIIYYMSPLYSQTLIPIYISKKKGLTKEQLIGICCGSASIFFFTLGIIISIINKKIRDKMKYSDIDDLSDSSEIIRKKEKIEENKNCNKEIDQYDQKEDNSEDDLLFWL